MQVSHLALRTNTKYLDNHSYKDLKITTGLSVPSKFVSILSQLDKMALHNRIITPLSFTSVTQANADNSRVDEAGMFGPLVDDNITYFSNIGDGKLAIGRAPGSCRYVKNNETGKYSYVVNSNILEQDIQFLINKHGIKTIIDVRNPKYEGRDCFKEERKVCEKNHIRYLNIPLDSAKTPTDKQFRRFLNAIATSPGKAYVHCHAGKDRTGIMAAYYLVLNGKTKDEAFRMVFTDRPDYEKGRNYIETLRYMHYEGNEVELEKFEALLDGIANSRNS